MAGDVGLEDYSLDVEEGVLRNDRREPAETPPRANKPFVKHAVIYGVGALTLQAASVVLVPLYTCCLTPAEFGVLEMLNRIGEVFYLCLVANGVRLAAFTFYCQAKSDQERRRTAATVLYAPMIVLLGCGLLSAAIAPFLDLLAGIDDSKIVVFAIVVAMLDGLTMVPLALIQARVESAYYVTMTAAMFCFRVTFNIAAVAWLGWGVWGVLGASAATSAVFGVILTWHELRKSSFRPDMKKLKDVFRFALPFVPVGLCGMLLHNGDRFFLMRFAGADELGLYALGYKVALVIGMLSTGPLCQVWTARMFEAFELPNAATAVGRVCTRILGAYLFVGTGVCIFEDELIRLLASSSYRGAMAVIAPVALAYFFWAASNLMDAPFWVRRRSGLKAWIIFASASVTLALYIWLIPLYHARGAAYATLLSMIVHCGITYAVSQRVFHVDYEFRRLAVMLAAAVALTLASRWMSRDLPGILAQLALWAAWPALMWWGDVVTTSEKEMSLQVCSRARHWIGRLAFGK